MKSFDTFINKSLISLLSLEIFSACSHTWHYEVHSQGKIWPDDNMCRIGDDLAFHDSTYGFQRWSFKDKEFELKLKAEGNSLRTIPLIGCLAGAVGVGILIATDKDSDVDVGDYVGIYCIGCMLGGVIALPFEYFGKAVEKSTLPDKKSVNIREIPACSPSIIDEFEKNNRVYLPKGITKMPKEMYALLDYIQSVKKEGVFQIDLVEYYKTKNPFHTTFKKLSKSSVNQVHVNVRKFEDKNYRTTPEGEFVWIKYIPPKK